MKCEYFSLNVYRFLISTLVHCSLESKVKEAMHQAFWDILAEKLAEDPPDLSHAVVLLAEVKEVGIRALNI